MSSDSFSIVLAREVIPSVPIYETDEYEIREGRFGRVFTAYAEFSKRWVERLTKYEVAEIVLTPPSIGVGMDLDFLRNLRELRAVSIHAYEELNWDVIESLSDILVISLRTQRRPKRIDFGKLSKLREARLSWHSEWDSVLLSKSIRHLTLEGARNRKAFHLDKLRSLSEFWAVDCRGLAQIVLSPEQRLDALKVSGCPSFKEIKPFDAIQRIEYLYLAGRSKFEYTRIGELSRLKRLWLNDVGKIKTLNFLEKCQRLETIQFLFSTNVLDGDLTVLQALPRHPQVLYERREHYRPQF
jgi:hypothetical protein